MKLYYSTGSCSMSCHIAIEEAGLNYTGVEVSFDKNLNVAELEKLNPLGVVPALVTDSGKLLTQNAAILEYIADQKPSAKLLAEPGTIERAKTAEWLSFVAADFHKAFGPLFMADMMTTNTEARQEIRQFSKERIKGYLQYIDQSLKGSDFVSGSTFTIADTYMITVLGWCKWMEITTAEYSNITAYIQRVIQRPAVQKVLTAHDMMSEYV